MVRSKHHRIEDNDIGHQIADGITPELSFQFMKPFQWDHSSFK